MPSHVVAILDQNAFAGNSGVRIHLDEPVGFVNQALGIERKAGVGLGRDAAGMILRISWPKPTSRSSDMADMSALPDAPDFLPSAIAFSTRPL